MNNVVIIGGGLSGLQCGFILSKSGYKVTVLEHDANLGGCLQSFRRGRSIFDTGFHYVGGLEPGQSLYPLFKYFHLLDLPWLKMDPDCFDEVVIGNESFPFAQGHDAFFAALADRFPHQKDGLRRYVDTLRGVGDHIFDVFRPDYTPDERFSSEGLFSRSAYEFLCSCISDPLLRDVLSGTSLKMQLDKERLPLYVFAQINNSFIQSAYRLEGGGRLVADRLREYILHYGGKVRLQSTVTRICVEDGRTTGVVLSTGEHIPADWVISSAHPAATMAMLDEGCIRRVYRNRISSLDNSFGMFTANLRLKPEALSYLNKNIYIHRSGADLWNVQTSDVNHLLVHFYPGQPALDLLTPMRFADVQQWANRAPGQRGEDYVAFKKQVEDRCIELASTRIPELRDAIDRSFTSSPLSYMHYLLAPEGSAYGVMKDCRSPLTTILSPRTPVQGLLYTGQSLNLHGILGVSMTSFFTCREILGTVPELDI